MYLSTKLNPDSGTTIRSLFTECVQHHEHKFTGDDDMDDPWGSPWADESVPPLPKLDKLLSKESVTSDKTLATNQDNKLPWGDDDGFGEWATLPATDELQVNEQEGPDKAEILEWSAAGVEKSTQQKDHVRPDGSTWFNRKIQPIDIRTDDLAIHKTVVSTPLPDPWAETMIRTEEQGRPPDAQDSAAIEQSIAADVNDICDQSELVTSSDQDGTTTEDVNEFDEAKLINRSDKELLEIPSISRDQNVPQAELSNAPTKSAVEEITQGESLVSRPSSSPSDHSRHDEILVESPRTSFEEEDKIMKLEREGHIKVKGMTRQSQRLSSYEDIIEPPERPRGHDISDYLPDTLETDQSEDDFGDFEEGIPRVSSKAIITEKTADADFKTIGNMDVQEVSALPMISERSPGDLSEYILSPNEQVQFETDLSLLNPIFGLTLGTEFTHADPKQALQIDTIIPSSFSSMDERKVWYRISRYTSMRKHNAGDEDSYVRINWKDSTVRAETLKIVARWIEQDRVGGGPGLGGSTRSGLLFGWGQNNIAPISVAAALASKSEKEDTDIDYATLPASSRNSNISQRFENTFIRKSLEHISVSRNSLQSPMSANAPQFNWSTGTPISPVSDTTLSIPPLVSPNTNISASGNSLLSPNTTKDLSVRDSTASVTAPTMPKSAAQHAKASLENNFALSDQFVTQTALDPLRNMSHLEANDARRSMISDPVDPQPPSSSMTSKIDAWAAADFSFFESPVPPKHNIAPVGPVSKAFTSPLTHPSQNHEFLTEQTEYDRIVKSIVRSLPDLSYMLRR